MVLSPTPESDSSPFFSIYNSWYSKYTYALLFYLCYMVLVEPLPLAASLIVC